MHLQEPGDLGRLDIVIDELSRMRDLVGEGQGKGQVTVPTASRAPWPHPARSHQIASLKS